MHALRPILVAQRADQRGRYKVSPFVTWAYLGLFFVPPVTDGRNKIIFTLPILPTRAYVVIGFFILLSLLRSSCWPHLLVPHTSSFAYRPIHKLLMSQCKKPFWNRPSWHVTTGNLSWASGCRKHAQLSVKQASEALLLLGKQLTLCSVCPQWRSRKSVMFVKPVSVRSACSAQGKSHDV